MNTYISLNSSRKKVQYQTFVEILMVQMNLFGVSLLTPIKDGNIVTQLKKETQKGYGVTKGLLIEDIKIKQDQDNNVSPGASKFHINIHIFQSIMSMLVLIRIIAEIRWMDKLEKLFGVILWIQLSHGSIVTQYTNQFSKNK